MTEPAAPEESLAGERPKARRPWSRSRTFQLFGVALVAGLLALLAWRLVANDRGSELVRAIRDKKQPAAPAFNLRAIWPHTETWPPALRRALADGKVAVGELRGHPVVINFWASWCVPCKEEAPLLAASARAHAGRVTFLGIDIQDLTSDARRFLRRYKVNYVSVRDGGSGTYSAYGLTGVPETYYLNRRGRIVAHSVGQVSARELETGITLATTQTPG